MVLIGLIFIENLSNFLHVIQVWIYFENAFSGVELELVNSTNYQILNKKYMSITFWMKIENKYQKMYLLITTNK